MNDMFENLKNIKTQMKKEENKKKENETKVDKQKKLQDEFLLYMQNVKIKKLS